MIGGVHIARIRSLVWGIYNVLATRVHSMVLGCICIVIDINDDRLSHRKKYMWVIPLQLPLLHGAHALLRVAHPCVVSCLILVWRSYRIIKLCSMLLCGSLLPFRLEGAIIRFAYTIIGA